MELNEINKTTIAFSLPAGVTIVVGYTILDKLGAFLKAERGILKSIPGLNCPMH
jgi:hypothetical protein